MRNLLFTSLLLLLLFTGFICHKSKTTSGVEMGTWQLKTIVDGGATQTIPLLPRSPPV